MPSPLKLDQPGFVLANAIELARASAAAYLPEGGAAPGLAAEVKPGTPRLVTSASTDTRAVLTEFEDCLVIAFRGTCDLRNWITDAEFPLRPLTGLRLGRSEAAGLPSEATARVHTGFLAAVGSVLPDLVAYLDYSFTSRGRPLVLTGHSLGGALAMLGAYLLHRRGFSVHSVYTFGQPRVGDRVFAIDYASRLGRQTYRVVNRNDLVPRLPGWLLGYRHAGELAFISFAGCLRIDPTRFSLLISDLLGLYRAWRQLDDALINDHFINHYVKALGSPQIAAGEEPF